MLALLLLLLRGHDRSQNYFFTAFVRDSFATPYSIPVAQQAVVVLPLQTIKVKAVLSYNTAFTFIVAGTGIEPVSRGYEPRELPLLYPAIFLKLYDIF